MQTALISSKLNSLQQSTGSMKLEKTRYVPPDCKCIHSTDIMGVSPPESYFSKAAILNCAGKVRQVKPPMPHMQLSIYFLQHLDYWPWFVIILVNPHASTVRCWYPNLSRVLSDVFCGTMCRVGTDI